MDNGWKNLDDVEIPPDFELHTQAETEVRAELREYLEGPDTEPLILTTRPRISIAKLRMIAHAVAGELAQNINLTSGKTTVTVTKVKRRNELK